MILNTGSRTDIPAFYAPWFLGRIREGFCLVRNPYYPQQVLRYQLTPQLVDVLVFCTKNPAPLLPSLEELSAFSQLWYLTITPYGRDIEPFVPPKEEVMDSAKELSARLGKNRVIWRYDPILLSGPYTTAFHLQAFEEMAACLDGYTERVVISFLDLYEKTKKNFPEGRTVPVAERKILAAGIAASASRHHMKVYSCLEKESFYQDYGIDTEGCMRKEVIEAAISEDLIVPSYITPAREGCRCLLGSDIGAYNTCRHFCRYCYANYDKETVLRQSRLHDPASPFLIGGPLPGDAIRDARQEKWTTGQLRFF